MKKISIKNIYLILIISIGLIGLGIGSTYAMFTSTSNIDNPISLSSNLSYSDDIFESFDITLNSKANKTIKFNINNNTQMDSIKYASWYIYNGNDSDLSFYTSIDSTSDIEPNGTLSSTGGTINIKIVNNTNKKINLVIGVSTSKDNIILPDYMKLISSNNEPKTTLAEHITNLYIDASKSTVTNNSIKYNYASSESLMNDRLGGTTTSLDGGNIRYYGASPNNYIYFNCETYPDTNCELWRIIGVFDGKVKLMRNEIIGEYSWDTSETSFPSSDTGNGYNKWSQADLMKLLNPGYESKSVGGSLYYNSKSGTCYNGQYKATTSCNFTSSGIKNDATREKIAEVTWNLGGWEGEFKYSNEVYKYERGTKVTSGNSTKWEGKIALPYSSDYGYATDFNKCSQKLYNYHISTDSYACRSNDWIHAAITNSSSTTSWLLTPSSYGEHTACHVPSVGGVDGCYNVNTGGAGNVYVANGVTPTLFLNSTETIYENKATGSQDNPYKLTP